MEYSIECRNLTKAYGKKIALCDVNLTFQRGRIIGLLGPNGSGKTTLIKLICGLLSPTSGTVLINGKVPSPETKAVVSYLPDKNFLPDWMKVTELIKFYKSFYNDFNEQKARTLFEKLHIDVNDKLKTMSKGTKEKVQLVLVMSRDADVYILDEPIAGVDPAARDLILNTIISNYNPNASVIISTHLIADVETVLEDIIFIKYGKIELQSSVDEIRNVHGKSVDALFREVYRC